MLPRPALLAATQAALARTPVVALLGPRQCGKTTLARQLVPADSACYFDLKDPISVFVIRCRSSSHCAEWAPASCPIRL
jgi:hypothetical protein